MSLRDDAILALLRQHGKVQVEDLARGLNLTPQTIRKDLRRLEDAGQVTRFHGGASLRSSLGYVDYEIRRGLAARAKAAIGRAAAERLPKAATVFINAGTTTEAAARALDSVAKLTVITDNVQIANIIRIFPGITTIVTGGQVRPADGAVVGAAAVSFLDQFRADYALIGAAAVAADGTLTDFDLDEALVARAMIRNAERVMVLADSTKFAASAPVRIGDLSRADTLITDAPSPATRDLCARAEVELVEVSP